MVAQPIPARAKRTYIRKAGVSFVMKEAERKATQRRATPARIVRLRPIFDATSPTGMKATIAAACAVRRAT